MIFSRLISLLAAFTICLPSTAFAVTQYYVTGLGTLIDPLDFSKALAINSRGQAAGHLSNPANAHAYLWDPSVQNGTAGSTFDLGDLPGGFDSSSATSINSLGQVAGESYATTGHRAFLWSPTTSNGTTGSMFDLGDLPGGIDSSTAAAINPYGQVVGRSYNAATLHAFLWTPSLPNGETGSMIDLGDLPGGADLSFAGGINSYGQVVGASEGPPKGEHAFLWTPTTPNGTTGAMVDLGDLPGGDVSSRANAINSYGQVVGQGSSPATHAFLWTPTTANETMGSMIDLGDLPGGTDTSVALAINSLGQVVGRSSSSFEESAFLWTPTTPNGTSGSLVDLNAMLDPISGAGWTLKSATGINDFGQIIGFGLYGDDRTRGFLLSPIPEPTTSALLILAACLLLGKCDTRHR